MLRLDLSRCAYPTLGTRRQVSTYTAFGFLGYGVASVAMSLLAFHWGLGIEERLIAFLVPPLAFILVVAIASAIVGHERIVFYQTACACVVAVATVGAIAGVRTGRLVDTATLGIGIFLVFGRLGYFSVACCHGTLGRGITYGPRHVESGFWARWGGRALWPVQLVESTASLVLVGLSLSFARTPGAAALLYIEGYTVLRFALELVRGDALRPYVLGVSEAQWLGAIISIACAVWRPQLVTVSIAMALTTGNVLLVSVRRRRELLLPPHLHELDRAMAAAADGAKRITSLGVAVSRHALPDGRIDWVLSAEHPAWSTSLARRLAHAMWPTWELVQGRAPGVVHVLVPA